MGVTKNYERQKSDLTNTTGMAVSLKACEMPGTPDVFDNAAEARAVDSRGNTGKLQALVIVDVDESGGASLKNLFRLETDLTVNGTTGLVTLAVTVTPVLGDQTDGTPATRTFEHPQSMDAFQTAAGRARQA